MAKKTRRVRCASCKALTGQFAVLTICSGFAGKDLPGMVVPICGDCERIIEDVWVGAVRRWLEAN
jgi:hypothetical protein